jgi:hypothetical protein
MLRHDTHSTALSRCIALAFQASAPDVKRYVEIAPFEEWTFAARAASKRLITQEFWRSADAFAATEIQELYLADRNVIITHGVLPADLTKTITTTSP